MRRIMGGAPPAWTLPVPEPFWFRWLPEATQQQFVDDWLIYGPPFITAIGNLMMLAIAWEAPAISVFIADLIAYWNANVGGTPPTYTTPYPTPIALDPGPSYPAPSPYAPPLVSADGTEVGWDCHKVLRVAGTQTLFDGVGRLLAATVLGGLVRFSSALGYTTVVSVALGDMETEVVEPCDGAIVAFTSVPAKYGSIQFDDEAWVFPRLGMLAFGSNGAWDERQKVEMVSGLYTPRNIADADIVRVRTKPGVTGTLTLVSMGALC